MKCQGQDKKGEKNRMLHQYHIDTFFFLELLHRA